MPINPESSIKNLGNHAVYTLLPRGQHQAKGLLQFVVAQARVEWARSERGESAGRHGRNVRDLPRQVGPQSFGFADGLLSIAMPCGFTRSHEVIHTAQRNVLRIQHTSHGMRGDISNQVCAGGRTVLVINHRQLVALLG